jgi:hypothetical protein
MYRPRHRACLASLLVLVAGFSGAFVAPVAAQTDAGTSSCRTTVEHLSFRTDNDTIRSLANGTQVSSIVDNTRVTIDDTGAFYTLHAENPNGYCVSFVVQVSERALPPAEIPGDVTSNNGQFTATWHSVYNFTDTEMYTEITFTLPSDSEATFAPSELRVIGLSWASRSTSKAESIWDRLTARFDDDPLEKHTYTLAPGERTTVVVPLENPETGEKITEYHAIYSINGGETWRDVTQQTTEPVYLREDAAANQLEFTFEDPDARVKFTANPTWRDDLRYQWKTYTSGIDLFGSLFGDDGGDE